MCRLFGMNAGSVPVNASYWLDVAPDSMLAQSHRNTDGTGIGWFTSDRKPHLKKEGRAAYQESWFSEQALSISAITMVTHLRAATTGVDSVENSHPFLIDGRLMAHNGGFGDLDRVDRELAALAGPDLLGQIKGATDSERYAALIAAQTTRHDGDVGKGIAAAAEWLSRQVPMYSLNTIVAAPGELWALRYPFARSLHVTTRVLDPATGDLADPDWSGRSSLSHHELNAPGDTPVPVVIVASERIDEESDWRMLDPGELIHVRPDLSIESTIAIDHPPEHPSTPGEQDPNDDAF